MIITEFNIKNVRSFKETTRIKLDPLFNILIGPNGSGKSNLLDIIHITIRHFFFLPYQINYNRNEEFTTKQIYSQKIFSETSTKYLINLWDVVKIQKLV